MRARNTQCVIFCKQSTVTVAILMLHRAGQQALKGHRRLSAGVGGGVRPCGGTWKGRAEGGGGRRGNLLIGEVRGEQLQGISNGNGGPGLHEVCSLAGLLRIPPVYALQELGQRSRLTDQAVPESPQQRPLLHIQRSAVTSFQSAPAVFD